jgi:hypothetical protein
MESNVEKFINVEQQPDGHVIVAWEGKGPGALGELLVVIFGGILCTGFVQGKTFFVGVIGVVITLIGLRMYSKIPNKVYHGIEIIPNEGLKAKGNNIAFKDMDFLGTEGSNGVDNWILYVVVGGNKISVATGVSESAADTIKEVVKKHSGMSFSKS